MVAQSEKPSVNSVMFSFQSKDHRGPETKLCKRDFQLLIFIVLSVLSDTRGEAVHASQKHCNNWNFKRQNTDKKKKKNLKKKIMPENQSCCSNPLAQVWWFNLGGYCPAAHSLPSDGMGKEIEG